MAEMLRPMQVEPHLGTSRRCGHGIAAPTRLTGGGGEHTTRGRAQSMHPIMQALREDTLLAGAFLCSTCNINFSCTGGRRLAAARWRWRGTGAGALMSDLSSRLV